MDKDALVTNLRKMSDKIIKDHKKVSLIMLLGNNIKPEEEPTSFDYIISASWLNNLSQDEGLDLILDYLYDNLTSDDLKHVSRVTIIHTNDAFVKNMSMIGMSGGTATLVNCQFNNLIIPYAILFES
nr:hypothetical protein [uncultured Trichococcus sp.]